MKLSQLTAPCLAIALACAAALPAAAQSNGEEMSAEELRALFLKQKTRGLVIAPTTPGSAETAPETTVVTAVEPATNGVIEIPQDMQINVSIKFDLNSSALRSDQKEKLANLCAVISESTDDVFRIIGHTDSSGSAQYNITLSKLRAEEVKRHFVSECGIPSERLLAVGVGEEQPLNKANPRADENRRVEFQIVS